MPLTSGVFGASWTLPGRSMWWITKSVGVLDSHCYQTLCGPDASTLSSCLATWPDVCEVCHIVEALHSRGSRHFDCRKCFRQFLPISSLDHSRALQACILPTPRNWRRRPVRPRRTWLRTVEEGRSAPIQSWTCVRALKGTKQTLTWTATSPTSSDWWLLAHFDSMLYPVVTMNCQLCRVQLLYHWSQITCSLFLRQWLQSMITIGLYIHFS